MNHTKKYFWGVKKLFDLQNVQIRMAKDVVKGRIYK